MSTELYDVLGIAEDASADDIKRAFRTLARQHHPDANGGDPDAAERYKQISAAYSILSDPEKRREYDMQRQGFGGFGGFSSTIEDIFESFFGGGGGRGRTRQRTRARHGEHLELALQLDLRDAIFGTSEHVTFRRWEPCEHCDGIGAEPGSRPERCDRCNGTGQLQQVRQSIFGNVVTAHPCAACDGTGEAIKHPCQSCGGQARIAQEVEVELEIPPGIVDGDTLRQTGQGHAGVAGGGRGDLYVHLSVAADERFTRSGDDLVTWVEVPMVTAALGGSIGFESLDGEEEIEIPRGTQSGELFHVRGKGSPRRRGGRGRGDLLVRVHVLTPTDLDGDQEQLLTRLAELRKEHAEGGHGIFGKLRRALGIDE